MGKFYEKGRKVKNYKTLVEEMRRAVDNPGETGRSAFSRDAETGLFVRTERKPGGPGARAVSIGMLPR